LKTSSRKGSLIADDVKEMILETTDTVMKSFKNDLLIKATNEEYSGEDEEFNKSVRSPLQLSSNKIEQTVEVAKAKEHLGEFLKNNPSYRRVVKTKGSTSALDLVHKTEV